MHIPFIHRLILLSALASAAWTGSACAQTDIYVYRDQGGVLNFTNMPSHDRGQTLVEVRKYRSSSAPRNTRVNYRPDRALPLRTMGAPAHVDEIVDRASADYQVDKALVKAMIHAESAFDAGAVSAKGASGLMQLMPGTAERYGIRNVFVFFFFVFFGLCFLCLLFVFFKFDLFFVFVF